MLITILIIACAGILTTNIVLIKGYRDIVAKYRIWVEGFREFFGQDDPQNPSDFIKAVDQIAIVFADRQRITMSAVDRGQQGAAVRDINRGLEEVAAENNPAYAIASSLPKSLKKNQLAQAGLMYFIQGLMNKQNGGIPGGSGPGPGGSGQSEFNF